MFANLTAVAVIIIVLWLIAVGLYLVSARHNSGIEEDIDAVTTLLDEQEAKSG
ncbi:MAG: hypothetical protein M9928_18375 [Anaerolineae bacterium]|nr:hypothetical protein [Anaerolineae bacterium]MCO5186965.1 hypothetical protein [Anaerolineae bacterium]MCO5191988.1 hypothetical protein [Anaerolineae bacterium]MCO5199086.1 hypothetical protein [Anaerolineae bacterium]MCO5206981.1 hypothetical protein [Anaerolineae bacterium]